MPLSTDVKLPRDATPVFPEACVVCGEEPDATIRCSARESTWVDLLWPLFLLGRKKMTFHAPACRLHASTARTLRWTRRLVFAVLIAGTIYACEAYLPEMSRSMRRWAFLLASLPALGWYGYMYLLRPLPFGLSVGRDTVTFEFAARDYALRFLDANPDAKLDV